MAKKLIKLPSISRFEPNGNAIVEFPIGPTYENVQFNIIGVGSGTVTSAMFGLIRVIANNTTIQEFKSLDDLMFINHHFNRSVDLPTHFMIHAKNSEFNDLGAQRATNWGTQGLSTLRMELQMNATLPAGLKLEATAWVDTIPEPLLVYEEIYNTSISSAVAGVVEYDKILRGGKLYKAIFFKKSDITNVQLEADSNLVINASKSVLNRLQESVLPVPRAPNASATALDFTLDGDSSDMFNTAGMNDLRARLTFGTAGNCDITTISIKKFEG